MALYVQETIKGTKGYNFGESDVQEAFTDDMGKLFKSLQQEYGRCVSKMYRDREGDKPQCIGWVFEKRMKYEDARGNDPKKDYYIREVWVSVHTAPPTKTIQYHYAEVG